MFDLILAAGIVVAGSLLIGCAGSRLSGSTGWSVAVPALGLSALLVVSSVAIRLPGNAVVSACAGAVLLAVSAAYLVRRRPGTPRAWGIVAVLLTGLGALIPFLASGRVGILGAGTSDDMSEHLVAAWTLQGHAPLAASKLVSSGYPVGPHALAATIAQATGISLERAFTGVIVAIPVLLALTAAALMPISGRVWRGVAGAAVGICYLQAAFLIESSFKEPIEALLVVGFAGALAMRRRERGAARASEVVPLAVVAAGSVYVYSYSGVVWLLGTLVLWWLLDTLRRRRTSRAGGRRARPQATTLMVAGGTFLVLISPEIPRMLDFVGSGYNHEGAAVFGNLLQPLPPLEATGIWPSVDFRFDVPVGSLSGLLALAAVASVGVVVWRSVRHGELILPAALLVAAGIWGLTSLRSPYTAAKSLAILAPLITLLLGREALLLLGQRTARWPERALGAAFAALVAVGAYSDLRVLREAPVQPSAHASELASLRPVLGSSPTLFLGADDYVQWELRGVNLATPPAPLYARRVVPLRRTKARLDDPKLYRAADRTVTSNRFAGLGLAYDFDSVPPSSLDRFTFAILPRSAYASAPPPNWRLVRTTRSYELWRRAGLTPRYQTLTEVGAPGVVLDCRTAAGRAVAAKTGVARVRPSPVVGDRWWWSGRVGFAGTSTHMTLSLGPGVWALSLQYDSVVPVSVKAPGLNAVLPANLEPLGPYWYVGKLRVPHAQRVTFVLRYHELPRLGRLLGSTGQTRAPAPTGLIPRGSLIASGVPVRDQAIPLHQACGRYVDSYTVSALAAAGRG